MDTAQLKKDIKDKTIKPYYIFTGEELVVQDIYINKIAESCGMGIKRVDSFSKIAHKLRSILITSPQIYVIRDDVELLSNDKVWANIVDILGQNKVIWLYTSLDKRGKFYKHFKEQICEFNHMSKETLYKYVSSKLSLSKGAIDYLIDICQCDYGRLLLEIDKLSTLEISTDNDFEKLLDSGFMYEPPRDAIFLWVDAVLSYKPKLAVELSQECKLSNESPLNMIYNLYNNVRNVIQVETCDSNNIEKSTGLSSWQIRNAKNKCGTYPIDKLMKILRDIQRVEKSIKMGNLDSDISIDYLHSMIFR